MNIFEWTDETPKEDRHLENPCLLWVWDSEVRIGYCHDGLAYWLGSRWVDREEMPIETHPDIKVTKWCYVPKAKSRRSPERQA